MLPVHYPQLLQRPRIRHAAALAVMAFAPALALATSNWSSVGSTGTPDELCAGRVSLINNDARLFSASTFSSCTMRYQVTDTWATNGTVRVYLIGRFTDNGLYAQVFSRLRSHNTNTGALGTLLTLNSNSYAAAATPQTRWTAGCVDLNFNVNSYFIEVDLTRSASPVGAIVGNPVIGQLRLAPCLI